MKSLTDTIDDLNHVREQCKLLAKRSRIDPNFSMDDKEHFCFLLGKIEGIDESVTKIRTLTDNGREIK